MRRWEDWIEATTNSISEAVHREGKKGVVFGASGGIDSLVVARLCSLALSKGVVGLQLIDSRVPKESYNPDLYESMGVKLERFDITDQLRQEEKRLGLPPRWLIFFLLRLISKLPHPAVRPLVLYVKRENRRASIFYQSIILAHRIRAKILAEFASVHELMKVICSNLTEEMTGYFVEGGIDDASLGVAPISCLLKTEVFELARFLGLPEAVLRQEPSPGFGFLRDWHVLGPYPMLDEVLKKISLGKSDEAVLEDLKNMVECGKICIFRPSYYLRASYVRFIRQLVEMTNKKRPSSPPVKLRPKDMPPT